jgi:hypothetical protein
MKTRISRDLVMFALGAFGFVHEVLVSGLERPFVLTACMALMGLPFVLNANNGKGKG